MSVYRSPAIIGEGVVYKSAMHMMTMHGGTIAAGQFVLRIVPQDEKTCKVQLVTYGYDVQLKSEVWFERKHTPAPVNMNTNTQIKTEDLL